MHQYYSDLLDLTDRKPVWWQEGGVPRFAEFHPDNAPDIYADEVALVEIACQACRTRFNVCMTSSPSRRVMASLIADRSSEQIAEASEGLRISSQIKAGRLNWGDPPNITCCAAGPSMSADMVKVLEFHHRRHLEYVEGTVITNLAAYNEWRRNADFEVQIEEKAQ